MAVIEKIARVVVLLGAVLCSPAALARADEPLPLRFELSENGAFRGNHTNVRHAWDGDCERLLASVQPAELPPTPLDPSLNGADWDKKTERRLSAAIEMYDRGLCVERDSRRAAALHLFHRFDYGGRHRVSLDFARRLWNGLGVEKDRDEAKRIMRIVLLWDLLKTRRVDHGDKTWTGHRMPEFGTALWRLLLAATETSDKRVDFAVALLDGEVEGPDGVSMPVYPGVAGRLLEDIWVFPRAAHQLALLRRAGRLGPDETDKWLGSMRTAARCWYIPAVWEMVRYDIGNARSGGWPPVSAVAYLWLLSDRGIDTIDTITEITDEFGMPADRGSYGNLIETFETVPEYCAME